MKVKKIDTSAWPDSIGHFEFIELLGEHLPEVRAQVDEDDLELLHIVMSVFERESLHAFTERLIAARRYFDFANEVLKRADPYVRNALEVSYIEGFVLGSKEEQAARAWMPEGLQRFYDEYEAWYDSMFSKGRDA